MWILYVVHAAGSVCYTLDEGNNDANMTLALGLCKALFKTDRAELWDDNGNFIMGWANGDRVNHYTITAHEMVSAKEGFLEAV